MKCIKLSGYKAEIVGMDKKKDLIICYLHEIHLKYKDTELL